MPDKNRAMRIIAEIVRQTGGQLRGWTRLYKAFYFAHLYYAELAPGYLSDWPIVKMPHGPGIDRGAELIAELKQAGVIATEHVQEGPFQSVRFQLSRADLPGEPLSDEATDAIRQAVQLVQERTAGDLSEMTHEFSRSWNSAQQGEELNIYIDLIPEDEYDARDKSLESMKAAFESASEH